MASQEPVLVVGAGPAGAAAAITLATAGHPVTVIDRARFPRDKICGDGLTAGALRLLDRLGLDPARVGSWQIVTDVDIRSPSGRTTRFPLPRATGSYAVVARRMDLDVALVERARAAGATVHDGHAITGIVIDDVGRAVVEVEGLGSIRARHVIAADGMWSPTRKLVDPGDGNAPAYLGEWHAFRQYFRGVGPQAASVLMVWFEPDLLPGYAWSFPLPGARANVGFGIQRGREHRTQDMKHLWPDLLARPHIRAVLGPDAEPEGPHRAWPIPARVDRVALTHGPVLFAGDAAAATDPMTGEGIGQALLSGVAAAEAVLTHGSAGTAATAQVYEAAIRRDLVADHRLARALSRVLAHPLGARGALRAAGLSPWTRRNFARWLFEDYPRAALLTPSRWHRGMLGAPGSYRANP